MAKLLPSQLVQKTVAPVDTDIIILQEDGTTEVKQINFSTLVSQVKNELGNATVDETNKADGKSLMLYGNKLVYDNALIQSTELPPSGDGHTADIGKSWILLDKDTNNPITVFNNTNGIWLDDEMIDVGLSYALTKGGNLYIAKPQPIGREDEGDFVSDAKSTLPTWIKSPYNPKNIKQIKEVNFWEYYILNTNNVISELYVDPYRLPPNYESSSYKLTNYGTYTILDFKPKVIAKSFSNFGSDIIYINLADNHVYIISTNETFTDTGLEATAISAGGNFLAAIGTDGHVYTTGQNNDVQLGLGNTTNVTSFTDTGLEATAISAGGNFLAAIGTDGHVYTTGQNSDGQLGLGNTINVTSFTDTGFTATAISAGGNFLAAIGTDGHVYTTGQNSDGQLGLGNTINVTSFTDTGFTATAINAKGYSLIAKSSTGTFSVTGGLDQVQYQIET